MNCDVLLKATKVDGVYSADPVRNQDAERYDLNYYDEGGPEIHDATAISLARKACLSSCSIYDRGAFAGVIKAKAGARSLTMEVSVAEVDLDEIKRRMDGALDALDREFSGLRTGRASANASHSPLKPTDRRCRSIKSVR